MNRLVLILASLSAALAIAHSVGCVSPRDSAREAMLSLPWQQFDQTKGSGWRIYLARKDHHTAALLIDEYLKRHDELTLRQRVLCHFHAGMEYVFDGNIPAALPHLDQAIVPSGITAHSPDWNDMVTAAKAFLTGDRAALIAAKARVDALPVGAAEWPNYPTDLLNNFGKPYGSW